MLGKQFFKCLGQLLGFNVGENWSRRWYLIHFQGVHGGGGRSLVTLVSWSYSFVFSASFVRVQSLSKFPFNLHSVGPCSWQVVWVPKPFLLFIFLFRLIIDRRSKRNKERVLEGTLDIQNFVILNSVLKRFYSPTGKFLVFYMIGYRLESSLWFFPLQLSVTETP